MDEFDPYVILSVLPGASRDEIKKQYRLLARMYHPDTNPGDERAARRFAMVQRAYKALSDAPEAAPETQVQGPTPEAPVQGPAPAPVHDPAPAPYFQDSGEFAQAFEPLVQEPDEPRVSAESRRPRLRVVRADIRLDQVVKPGATYLEIPGIGRAAVKIPAGADTGTIVPAIVRDGERVERLAVELRLLPDPRFERRGLHLVMRYPLDAERAWRGLGTDITTLWGPVRLVIPPRSRWGDVVTIPCKGIMGGVEGWGSLFVEIARP